MNHKMEDESARGSAIEPVQKQEENANVPTDHGDADSGDSDLGNGDESGSEDRHVTAQEESNSNFSGDVTDDHNQGSRAIDSSSHPDPRQVRESDDNEQPTDDDSSATQEPVQRLDAVSSLEGAPQNHIDSAINSDVENNTAIDNNDAKSNQEDNAGQENGETAADSSPVDSNADEDRGECARAPSDDVTDIVRKPTRRHRWRALESDPVGAIDKLLDMTRELRNLVHERVCQPAPKFYLGDAAEDYDNMTTLAATRELHNLSDRANFEAPSMHDQQDVQQVEPVSFSYPKLPPPNDHMSLVESEDGDDSTSVEDVLIAHGHGVTVLSGHEGSAGWSLPTASPRTLAAFTGTPEPQRTVERRPASKEKWNLRHAFLRSFRRASLSPEK